MLAKILFLLGLRKIKYKLEEYMYSSQITGESINSTYTPIHYFNAKVTCQKMQTKAILLRSITCLKMSNKR